MPLQRDRLTMSSHLRKVDTSTIRIACRAFLTRMLEPGGVYPTAMTEPERIRKMLTSLYPLCTNHSLIRLGPRGDGGYLVPDDLDGIAACFSPGVSLISGFEKDCAVRGMRVFMADRSVDGPAEQHPLFHFTKRFVGVTSNDDFTCMSEWVGLSAVDPLSDLLLQIDIEGYEYEVLLSMPQELRRRFRIIVAEFHMMDQLPNRAFFMLASRVMEMILQTHACVHIHPNNCAGSVRVAGMEFPKLLEFTFLRRDRIASATLMTSFPHELDCDNADGPPLVLPNCWYGGSA
jgi:hypothetical protein